MIYITGAAGMLGVHLEQCGNWWGGEPVYWGTRKQMDITDPEQVWRELLDKRPRTILHLAAWTDVAGAEKNRQACWDVNVVGTRNIVQASKFIGARIVYVSTDYVFDGKDGGYNPLDPPNPINYYALTKLVGEQIVSSSSSSLIVRLSIKPFEWKHPAACTDMWTSADYVDVIAPKLKDVVASGITGIYHLGPGRKSIFELARQRRPDVKPILRSDIKSVALPEDVSFGDVVHVDWPSV